MQVGALQTILSRILLNISVGNERLARLVVSITFFIKLSFHFAIIKKGSLLAHTTMDTDFNMHRKMDIKLVEQGYEDGHKQGWDHEHTLEMEYDIDIKNVQ